MFAFRFNPNQQTRLINFVKVSNYEIVVICSDRKTLLDIVTFFDNPQPVFFPGIDTIPHVLGFSSDNPATLGFSTGNLCVDDESDPADDCNPAIEDDYIAVDPSPSVLDVPPISQGVFVPSRKIWDSVPGSLYNEEVVDVDDALDQYNVMEVN